MAVLAAKTTFAIASGRAFWVVLIGTFVSNWWNNSFGALINGCMLLGAYIHAERAAGSFASWVMHDMPWASVGIQYQHFKGVVNIPAKVVEAVNRGDVKPSIQLMGFAVCLLSP